MTKQNAVFIDCPGITNEGVQAHEMRDNCWSCAPFWARIPLCPVHRRKLATSGYCKLCHKFYKLEDPNDIKAEVLR